MTLISGFYLGEKIYLKKKRQYYTLVSEFMLQQTQVATVIPFLIDL